MWRRLQPDNSHLAGGAQDARGLISFDWKQTANKTAYSLGAVTYGLCQTSSDAKNKVVAQFFEWMIKDYGLKNAEALGYTPILGASAAKGIDLSKKCGAG